MSEDYRPMAGLRGRAGLLPVLLVVVAAVPAVLDRTTPVLPTLVATAVAACWLGGMALWRDQLLARRWSRAGCYVGLLVLLSALVAWSPWFMLVSWTAFVYAFVLFEARWAFFWAAGAGVALTVAQARSPMPTSSATLPLFLVSLVVPLVVAGWYLGRESDSRRRLIDELAAAAAANEELRDQLLNQARAGGVHQERQRMAREIHDTLAQGLSAMVAQLEVALTAGDGWQGRVVLARDLAREGLAEARRSVRALAPPSLDDVALPEALRRLTGRWRQQTDVDALCDVDQDVPALPARTEAALLRVAQAALANVAEHADAARVRVTLSCVDDAVRLDVRDDGVGFDPARIPVRAGDRGFGLAGMRQRLGQLGGWLSVESAPGAGTAICAGVPL